MIKVMKKVAFLFTFFWSALCAANGVSLDGVYDEKSGNIFVDVNVNYLVEDKSRLEFKLDYKSPSSRFIKAVYSVNSISSYSSSQAGSVGQVNASAIFGSSTMNPVVRLYFGTTDPSMFQGVFTSLQLNGVEFGPMNIPPISYRSIDATTPVIPPVEDGQVPTADNPSAPTDIKASGLNRAISVNWLHPNDNVIGYKAMAYQLNGKRKTSDPIASCEASSTASSCVIEKIRNHRLYQVVVNAIYPGDVFLASMPSNAVMPSGINYGGICRRFFGIDLAPKFPATGRVCRVGKPLFQNADDGYASTWSCIGFGYGDSQECKLFE